MTAEIELLETNEGHYYKITATGAIYPSVTTVLSHTIPKIGLEIWKSRNPDWRQILKDAQDVGKKSHSIIEKYLKDEQINHLWCKEVEYTFPSFLKWKFKHAFELIHSELMTFCIAGFGGTIDVVCRLDGKLTLCDIKTGNHFYPEQLLQLCGYRCCYEERTGQEIENMGILKLEKDEIFYTWREFDNEDYIIGLSEFFEIFGAYQGGAFYQ